MQTRIYFLDNLRTFLIFLVILIHAGIVYEPILENSWLVSDPVKNSSIGLIRMYLELFVMYMWFFIAGYFVVRSASKKTSLEFIKSKFIRLIFPWVVAVFILIPAYKAIFLFSRGLPQEEWFSYFHVFERTGTDLSNFANNPVQNWLWFLPVLFFFQVVYLGLLKANLLTSKISLKTGVGLVVLFGLIYNMIISLSGHTGWTHNAIFHFQNERLLVYFLIFLLGTLCYKLNVFESEKKNTKLYIISNVVLTLALGVYTVVALNLFFNMIDPGRNYFFVNSTIDRIGYYLTALLSMLSFMYVFIHVFRFYFKGSNSLMKHLNNNSYSVYIIHVIVMGLLALVLLKTPLPAIVKYFILAILTFVISNVMAYAYKQIFKKQVSIRVAAATLVAGLLLTIAVYANQGTSSIKADPTGVAGETATVPEMGLHDAAIQGELEIIRKHIKAGSDLDMKEPSGGSSPLITAALFGMTEVAAALIEGGANVNFQNNEGSTPLITAAFFGRKDIVEILIANGANKNIKNNSGSTALESASAPFESVKGIYDYFGEAFGPLGLELDYERLKTIRQEIAKILTDSETE